MEYKELCSVFDKAEQLISGDDVTAAIKRLGAEITTELEDKTPVLLSVMNGGLIFTGQLLTHLRFPLETGYVHATRYGDEICGSRLQWLIPPPKNIRGRTVLLLDDILDEGVTLQAIADTCLEMGAERLLTAVLLDKQHNRKAYPGCKADFTGLEIPDRFVFGFGLDYKGYWRNAYGIYAIK